MGIHTNQLTTDNITTALRSNWERVHNRTRYTLLYQTHYTDTIMGAIASQITSLTIVYSTVYLDTDQRKHQSSAALAFVRGIHRRPVISPHKWPVTRKMFPFDDVIMGSFYYICSFKFFRLINISEKSKPFCPRGSLLGAYAAFPFIHLFIYPDTSICHYTELAENWHHFLSVWYFGSGEKYRGYHTFQSPSQKYCYRSQNVNADKWISTPFRHRYIVLASNLYW